MFKVGYLDSVRKTLTKMDPFTRKMIVEWINKNLFNCDNPRAFGKPLKSNRSGQWRYRVGDYRIIVKIEDDKLIILVIAVGHRREVYNS